MTPRPEARIEPFLEELKQLWLRYPHLRFGQLMMNLSRSPGGFDDIWEWDVETFHNRIVRAHDRWERV